MKAPRQSTCFRECLPDAAEATIETQEDVLIYRY